MNSKTWLVARREFLENLRTKTFWIGIAFLPIVLSLAIAIPMWLDKKQSQRKYVVIDHSGWLLEAVEERATLPDLEKVFAEALKRHRNESASLADLPESLQNLAKGLDMGFEMAANQGHIPQEGADRRREEREGLRNLSKMMSGLSGPEGERLKELFSEEIVAELKANRDEIKSWWEALPAEEAKEYAGGLSKSRYARVEVEGRGQELIEELNRQIREEELFAYFVLPEDPVNGTEDARYVSNNLTDDDLRDWFGGLASEEVRSRRLAAREIDPEVARWVQKPLAFNERTVSAEGAEEEVQAQDRVRQFAPMVFLYILCTSVLTISQMLLTNTVEEKSNRILEVLLSSVSPLQLMNGKILGIALTGMTMVVSWVFFFVLVIKYVPRMLGADLPVDLSVIARDPVFLASFILYFLLGYLFYAGLLVGIGSVCDSMKEAQNLQTPVILLLMAPFFTVTFVNQDPNGTLAQVLSFIPPLTPFIMMNRAAGPPAVWEYVATTILMVISIVLVFWAAAKVFRVGVLMTGKAPTPGEIFRWIKAPIGLVPERKDP